MKNKRIVTFGELLLRFSKSDHMRLTQGSVFTSIYGGSEANVAVSLASLGDDVEYITRLPDTPVAKAGVMRLQELGVNCKRVLYGGNRIGTFDSPLRMYSQIAKSDNIRKRPPDCMVNGSHKSILMYQGLQIIPVRLRNSIVGGINPFHR